MTHQEIIKELQAAGLDPYPTGSRSYGTPHEGSDYDYFVLMSWRQANDWADCADHSTRSDPNYPLAGITMSLRFGDLNLLVLAERWQFDAWHEGTYNLIDRKPVTRDEAVEEFQAQFARRRPCV